MIVDRVYPSLKNFPKIEQHGLCKFIKHTLFVCAGRLNLAAFVKSQRSYYLQLAQSAFEDARTYLKASHNFKYISTGFWRELD